MEKTHCRSRQALLSTAPGLRNRAGVDGVCAGGGGMPLRALLNISNRNKQMREVD